LPSVASASGASYPVFEMPDLESFIQFTKVHEWLDELFLAHQTALLSLDIKEAKRCLDAYDTNLRLHIKDEEDLLIPTYGARASDIPGGAVEFFTGEHKKILGFLGEFHEMLSRLRDQKTLQLKHAVIQLLDREGMYKGLLQHHHAREHNVLYPWLDWLTSEAERKNLLEQCSSLKAYTSR
jgi:hemerythrin-like domain-containing protein